MPFNPMRSLRDTRIYQKRQSFIIRCDLIQVEAMNQNSGADMGIISSTTERSSHI